MTYPSTSGSRLAAPVTPAASTTVNTLPPSAVAAPHPGEPGFIGATTHEDLRGPLQQRDRRRHRSPLGWLPWALLAALLGLLLLMLLAGSLVGRDSGTDHRAAANSGTSAPNNAAGAGSGSTGTLVSNGGDLLAGNGSLDKLRDLSGKAVTGHHVLVQSVVADEGLWVGSSTSDRAFVYLTPQARKTNGESPFQVRAGQHVEIDGTIGELAPNGAAKLGVTDTEGARQLTSQRGYVVAKSVRLSS